MGELKGMMLAILIFGAFIIPLQLDIWRQTQVTTQMSNMATELQQIIQNEGGVSNKVKLLANRLEDNTDGKLDIDFRDESGRTVNSIVDYDTQVNIEYTYDYEGIFGINTDFETSNGVTIRRR